MFDVGERVSWDRADLPRGVGTVVEPEPGHVEGWYRVRDDHYGAFLFPEDQLKKSRAKVPE